MKTPSRPKTNDLAAMKTALSATREKLRRAFMKTGDADAMLTGHAEAIDALIASLFETATAGEDVKIAAVAVGGYGRGELFPYSDIDLLFLHDGGDAKRVAKIAEAVLYALWDLGLTIGQAHRSVDEAIALAKEDITIRTNLLDARMLAGSKPVFEKFRARYDKDIRAASALEFVEAKLAERDGRHLRFGDSRYMLEPNVKEGKGGLRDLHTLWWLARYVYPIAELKDLVKMGLLTREEYQLFDRSRQFLCKTRIHLHYLAGHAEERISFDRQQALGVAMGYEHPSPNRTVERFMRRYFVAVRMGGMATRIVCALLEDEKKRKPRKSLAWLWQKPWAVSPFRLDGQRLAARSDGAFEENPIQMLEIFKVAQTHQLDIHPRTLQLIARNLPAIDDKLENDARANAVFLEVLVSRQDAETTLRKMSDAGVLGKFIPDFGRVIGQTQFNMYHVFTVDEHTLVAIGILHAIENGHLKKELPLATDIIARIKMRRVLYVALLCHDIAKGRGGDHSLLGEKIVMKLARRFGFSDDEVKTAAWLVRDHLVFTNTAFKRDINDPKTIQDFVAVVQSPERLKLLYVLTLADMRAVSPGVWNAWKGALLDELYRRSEQAIGTGKIELKQQQAGQFRKELAQLLHGWSEREIDGYLEVGNAAFFTSCGLAHHAAIARMLKEAARMPQPLLVDTQHDYERKTTEITVCTLDQHGLFAKLAGALALAGANIVTAQIFTLKNGMAVDVFSVQDASGEVFDRADRLAKMSVYIEQALSGEMDIGSEFAERKPGYRSQRKSALAAPGQVFIENDASNIHSVIEITGTDRIGFLYQVTRAIADLNLSIASAHISTYGTQVADVFYVKDIFGMKINHDSKIQRVREALLKVVNADEKG